MAAILFTDMVGYTALGQKNESLALEVLERHRDFLRPIFSKHRGREVKTMGDSFLIEFESALEATLCAIDVQNSVHSLNLERGEEALVRIGIHLGDVVHREGDVLGDAVNVASRIEPLAGPGGICISEQVHDHVKNKISYPLLRLDAKELKNVSEPLEVYRVVMPWEQRVGTEVFNKRRVAVMPLMNMISDPSEEYFADGMTEELISALCMVPELSVISRTSVMHYKNQTKNVAEIGRELNVGTLLEGSVRKSGNRVRIAVQLIDASSDKHLWAESYDRNLEDVFSIQSEIAQNVASALKIRLLEGAKERIGQAPTEDSEAHTLYLKGLYFSRKGTKEGYEKAIQYFRSALEKDSSYALAYCELAHTYEQLGNENYLPEKEAFPKARELVTRALDLDEALAEGHIFLGEILMFYDWNWSASEREVRRGLELNPNLGRAHATHAFLLVLRGQRAEAIAEMRMALSLEPNSIPFHEAASFVYFMLRLYDSAIEESKESIRLDPDNPAGHANLGISFLQKGMFDEAFTELKRAVTLSNGSDSAKSNLAFGYAISGNRIAATQGIDELTEASKSRPVAPFLVAQVFAALGDRDKAFEWMEKAYEERSSYLPWIKVDPMFDSLRTDPRYPQLLTRLGI